MDTLEELARLSKWRVLQGLMRAVLESRAGPRFLRLRRVSCPHPLTGRQRGDGHHSRPHTHSLSTATAQTHQGSGSALQTKHTENTEMHDPPAVRDDSEGSGDVSRGSGDRRRRLLAGREEDRRTRQQETAGRCM